MSYEIRPIGTKLKWQKDANNSRTAIVTKDGILEVKKVLESAVEYPCMLFNIESEWRNSLPEGGNVTVTMNQPSVNITAPIVSTGSDAEKLKEVMSRFRTNLNRVRHLPSDVMMLTYACQRYQWRIRQIPGDSLNSALANLNYWTAKVGSECEAKAAYRYPKIENRSTSRILISVGDEIKEISYDLYEGEHYIVESNKLRYKSFAEIGDCLNANGKPKISVEYRKKIISIAHLF